MTSGIYRLISKLSGKMYIGFTSDFVKRKSSHFTGLAKGKHENPMLQNYYNKYGNVFNFEIIEECSKELLEEREMYYIGFYNTQDRSKGFNRTSGGRGSRRSKDVQELIIPVNKKKIGQYDLDGNLIKIHDSISECAKSLNVLRTWFKPRIKKKKYCAGFLFCYSLEQKIEPYKRGKFGNKTYVFDTVGNLLGEFEFIIDVSKEYNINSSTVYQFCDSFKFCNNKYYFRTENIFDPKVEINSKISVYNNKGILLSVHDNMVDVTKYHDLNTKSCNNSLLNKRFYCDKYYFTIKNFYDYKKPIKVKKKINIYDENKKHIETYNYFTNVVNTLNINKYLLNKHLETKTIYKRLNYYFLYEGDTF